MNKDEFTNKMERAKRIGKAIEIVYRSLESHAINPYFKKVINIKDLKFHQDCVKEYAELIKILSELY
jgi:hypothetical protein